MKKGSDNLSMLLFLLPSLIGVLVFFVIPFIISFYYSLIDNSITASFVGLKNFTNLIGNANFQLAFKNTVIFILICVPLNFILPLLFAILINQVKKSRNIFGLIFLLPLVIPTGSIVFFWKNIFGLNGVINKLFFLEAPVNWIQSGYVRMIIVVIFLWKNMGYNIVLFMAGINFIPREYYETALIEGAGAFQRFTKITIVYLVPTGFLVFIMSIINSFKSFKEIYLLAGNYPNESIYMLQHYINNQFSALNYQKLVSSAYILFIIITIIVIALFSRQHKYAENF